MEQIQLYTNLQYLPNDLKSEVNNFVEFLLAKRKKELKKKSPRYGSAKGQIYMSADFDDPLEDFKAYM
ncbi:DUF2281 domain-containing protein [Dysgonomonas sp. Marseille-P4361]|jgi:uncharacterized protein YaaN involved in tellurite resistance|uniref:type II toxin-antitoxin system VapB family antitoxin n=1 Tax=Dysgonomonas sp. Marseille-P4361 TaxID=2161820 RepID=UPI00092A3609|nr:DUF2281 domain-containing protein [Dysgonomonas sp. Marseille-P4361]OJV87079.1 MAG: hypothetical protein BGO34_11990 [Bacteroidia bacterium 44-10]